MPAGTGDTTGNEERVTELSAVTRVHFDEPAALMGALAGAAISLTPLPSGTFSVDFTDIHLGDVVLSRGACSPLLLAVTVAPDFILLNLPLTNTDTLMLNGQALPERGFGLHGPGSRILRINPRPNRYALIQLRTAAAAVGLPAARAALGAEPGASVVLAAADADWSRLARLVNAAMDLAEQSPDIFETEPPRAALRATLLGVAEALIEGAHADERSSRRAQTPQAWQRVVMGAEEYLTRHLDRPIYTEELCRELGVSPAALSDAFRGTLAMSPHRYLKLRRLNMVRAALLQPDGGPILVKSVALSHGFWHLGQFARDYREAFGETPSETLSRSAHPPEAKAPAGQAEPTASD